MDSIKKIIIFIGFTLILASCASKPTLYFGGKYSDKKVGDNLYSVVFEGDGRSSREIVSEMLLLRCSEISFNQGYRYFIVLKDREQWEGLVLSGVLSEGNKMYTMSHVIQLLKEPLMGALNYDAYKIYEAHLQRLRDSQNK